LLDLANTVQSPALKFDAPLEDEPLPVPPQQAVSPAEVQRMQRRFDEQRNWALLTPEQILGLPTPEQILGVPDRDGFGRPKNETVLEQYYEREGQLRTRTNNDNYGAADLAPHGDFSGSQALQMNTNSWFPAGGGSGNSPLMNQLFNTAQDNPTGPFQAPKGGWSKSFNLPAPPLKPTPEQQAAVAQFQQLLQPRSLSGGSAKVPALGSPLFSPPQTAPNPASGQFATTPVGASFAPLNSGIAMPMGTTPLPGLLGPTNMTVQPVAPAWKPPLPPWMSSGPQPGVIPQRKF
jgi:hypothetical protein